MKYAAYTVRPQERCALCQTRAQNHCTLQKRFLVRSLKSLDGMDDTQNKKHYINSKVLLQKLTDALMHKKRHMKQARDGNLRMPIKKYCGLLTVLATPMRTQKWCTS